MQKKTVFPLMRGSHLTMTLLAAVTIVYGLATVLTGSWLSSQAMRGLMTVSAYRTQLAGFEQIAGAVASLLLLVLFVLCAIGSRGSVRVAFATGALASAGPALVGRAEPLLFRVIGLPTMGAGSVLSSAVTVLAYALPLTILFLLLAVGRNNPRGCRWLSMASILVVLGTALFPVYVTVLAFLLKPGDPGVGAMMDVSSRVMQLRFILPGLCLLVLSILSARYARVHPAMPDQIPE
ncbi:MAG: hypothetical protein MUF84_06950 [Anaerolineae bacterium]|jgi:hypothetical protein|nr:hypothetical protein [Anaerolineae bacterium]